MRLEFRDFDANRGWAEDDGNEYTWEYDGDDQEIIELLTEAEDYTDIDTAEVTEGVDGLEPTPTGERFDAPVDLEVRIMRIRSALRSDVIIEYHGE